MDYRAREDEAKAKAYYNKSMQKVKNSPEPAGQKFHAGQRVFISREMPMSMCHFTAGKWATVEYTYAHAYGGDNIDSYSLNIEGHGSVAWYPEYLLSLDGSDAVIPKENKHYPDKCSLCRISKEFAKDMQDAVDKAIIGILKEKD